MGGEELDLGFEQAVSSFIVIGLCNLDSVTRSIEKMAKKQQRNVQSRSPKKGRKGRLEVGCKWNRKDN